VDETSIQLDLPVGFEGGAYSNFLSVWHSAHELTLDFGALQRSAENSDGDDAPLRYRIVSRVRIPVTMCFDILRLLNERMTEYEREFGEIRPPGGQLP